MRELTDVALFVEYLQSAPLRSSEIELGRGYSPYRSLEYDCACGRRHELKKKSARLSCGAGSHSSCQRPNIHSRQP